MGVAPPIQPYSMPFMAKPLSSMPDVSNLVIQPMPVLASPAMPESFSEDAFLQQDEDPVQLFQPSAFQRQGVLRFIQDGIKTPVPPPPDDTSACVVPPSCDLSPESVRRFLNQVAAGRIEEIRVTDERVAVALLKTLVFDRTLALNVFEKNGDAERDSFIFRAIQDLSIMAGDSGVGLLRSVLRDARMGKAQQFKAIEGLRVLRASEALPELEALVMRPAPSNAAAQPDLVRRAAILMLEVVEEMSAIPALTNVIGERASPERQEAIRVMGEIIFQYLVRTSPLNALEDDVEDDDLPMNTVLISTVNFMLEEIAFDSFEGAAVRSEALVALGKLGKPAFFEPIMEIVQRFIEDDHVSELGRNFDAGDLDLLFKGAIEALGWLGDARAEAVVIAIAKDRSKEDEIRREALETLSTFDTPSSIMAAISIADDDTDPLQGDASSILKTMQLGGNGESEKN
jgi:HEAT repeat protein